MKISQSVTVLLALASIVSGLAPAAWAQQPPPAEAQASSLHDRIDQAYEADPLPDPDADLKRLQPVMDEALAATDLDVDDFARISLVYGLSLYNLGRPADAKVVVKRALDAVSAAKGDDDKYLADLLKNYAIYQTHTGDPEGGLATQKRALDLAIKQFGPDAPEVGAVYGALAFSCHLLGRLEDAIGYYDQALARMDPKDAAWTSYVATAGNYANELRLNGDYEKAIAWSTKAVDAATTYMKPGDRGIGYAYNSLGDSLFAVGRYAEAEALYRQAQEYAVQYRGKTAFEAGLYTYSLARSLNAQGNETEALPLMQTAYDIVSKTGSSSIPDIAGSVLNELAVITYTQGDLDASIAYDRQALDALAPLGVRGLNTRSRTETHLGQALLVAGRPTEALPLVEDALVQYRAQYEPFAISRANAEMLRCLILARLGRTDEAFAAAQPIAQAMTEKIGSAATSRGEQIDLSSTYQLNFGRYADIAYSSGHADLAFAAAQLAGLSEVANTSQALAARGAAADPQAASLARQLQDIQLRRQRLDRARNFARGKSDTEVAMLNDQIAAADALAADTAVRLQAIYPQYSRISHPRPVTPDEARRRLASDEAVILPVLVDDRTLVLALTQQGLVADSSPLNRPTAGQAIRAIRAAAASGPRADGGFDRAPSWTLGQAVFTPRIQAALHGKGRLDVMASGSLVTVPFSILLTTAPQGRDDDADALRRSDWVVASYAVTVKPSLSATDVTPVPTRGFLGIGAPVLGPAAPGYAGGDVPVYRGDNGVAVADIATLRQMPSLPGAEDELKRMQTALGQDGSTLIMGSEATETRVKSDDLSHYDVIAFATHGLISGNLASLREPALVMTPPPAASADDDGLLTASEVAGLRLNARWVILSACNTGSARDAGAAGYSGLANGFMQAGARNLLVSLWPVRDDIADRLSVDTVKNDARGLPQAEALRQAVLSIVQDRSVQGGANPLVWGPFSLVTQ